MSLWQACNDWQKLVFSMGSKWFLHNPVFHWGKPSIFSQWEQEQLWWKKYNQILQPALLYEAQQMDLSVWGCSVANRFLLSLHLNTAGRPLRPLQKVGMVGGSWLYCSPLLFTGKIQNIFQRLLFHGFLVLFAQRRSGDKLLWTSLKNRYITLVRPREDRGIFSPKRSFKSELWSWDRLKKGKGKLNSSFRGCKTIAALCLGVKISYVPPKATDSSLLCYRALLAPEEDSSDTSCTKLSNNLGKAINCVVINVQVLILSLLLHHLQLVCCCVITGLLVQDKLSQLSCSLTARKICGGPMKINL